MPRWQEWVNRRAAGLLIALTVLALGLRAAAFMVLDLPVESDAAAYLTIAESLARTGVPTDMFGQHGFYSIGYPVVLAPFVAFLGATASAALTANLLLALLSIWLLVLLGHRLALPGWAHVLVVALYATWLPGIWNAASVARENLSTPLLLGVLLASLAMLERRRGAALLAGLLCGGAMLAGGSAVLLGLAPLTALWIATRGHRDRLLRGGAALAAGLLIAVGPWLLAMQAMTGSATLASSSGFNFYLGHNPAATGTFVSIADTPAGPRWEGMRQTLGEAGASAELAREGRAFIAAEPLRALELTASKLVRFWTPNLPDAADMAAAPLIAAIRWIEVGQYLLLLSLAAVALLSGRVARDHKRLIVALVAGFWLVHAAAYVLPRYRDPLMPVMMLLAAATLARRGVRYAR